jgi:PAS domain S-box-containing protein
MIKIPLVKPHPTLVNYAVAIAAALLAASLQWSIRPWVGSHAPFIFLIPAVILCAILLGRNPAFAVLMIGAVNGALLAPPVGSLLIANSADLAAVIIFCGVGAVLAGVCSHLSAKTRRTAIAEKHLQLALQNTGIGVFELDFAANTAFVSPSLCKMLGQPPMRGAIPLSQWLGALHPAHVQESKRVIQRQIDAGNLHYEAEQRVPLHDGETRWLLNRVELEVTAEGQVTRARGATVDITARRQTDDLLKATQAKLQEQVADLERLHDFSQRLVASRDDFPAALQGLLEVMLDLFGTRHAIVSLYDGDARVSTIVALAGFVESDLGKQGHPVRTDCSSAAAYAEMVSEHRALATQAQLEEIQSVALLSAGGDVLGVISVMFDHARVLSDRERRLCAVCAATAAAVVEREHAKAIAARIEQRFSTVLQASVVPFNILAPVRDARGQIVDFRWAYLNPAAARALLHDARELTGQCIGEIMPRTWDAPGLLDRYVSVIERDQECEFEIMSIGTSSGRWFNVIASPLQGSVAVWFSEITERKRIEQDLHEAARRKDEFLATLAHELRNPLAPIRQGVQLSRAPLSTEAQRRWSLEVIERQVNQMSLLLDDLLDVSRVGRGTLLLRKSAESLAALVDTAVETARPHVEAKRHRLRVELPETPVMLDIDPLRMAQVLGNLLTNAAKYTDPGGEILLSVELQPSTVVIRVQDTGIGLGPDQITQVFEMFAQIPGAVEKSQGGLGIGLALARGLVRLHGGNISAHSDGPGRGSTFTVSLPSSCVCVESAPAAGGDLCDDAQAVSRHRPTRCILIADDNIDAADSLAELLRLDGHEVYVAYDGEEALATFSRVQPEAALLDVGMPGLSGLEVVRAIRKNPSGQRATLIAVTGWGQERDKHSALEAGFDHHMTKPMIPEAVQAMLEIGRTRPVGPAS